MGADLLIWWVPAPVVDRDTALGRVVAYVEAMDDGAVESLWNWHGYTEVQGQTHRERLAAALAECTEVLYEERRRDVVTFEDSAGAIWLMTGGMSYGDTPTDAADAFSVLNDTGFDEVLATADWTAG